MPSHWTYAAFDPDSDLEQGDLLEPTDALREIFRTVHPHFHDPKYIAFAVITQACDLVRRPRCKTDHIELAVVRELSAVMPDFLHRLCGTSFESVFRAEGKLEAKRFLQRVFNQNEQGAGLFYLHPDADVSIAVPSVIVVRVSIALRNEHYPSLMAARTGRLTPEFQNRLGWLIGNLYSRVPTPDWSDRPTGKKIIDALADGLLQPSQNLIWAKDDCIKEAEKREIDINAIPPDKRLSRLLELMPKPPKTAAIDRVSEVVKEAVPTLTDEDLKRIANRLRNDGPFKAILDRFRG